MNDDRRMQAFLGEVSRRLVRSADEVEVAVVDGRRATTFEIRLPESERGQLIGRGGATIRNLRTLASVSAKRHRRRFEVEIED